MKNLRFLNIPQVIEMTTQDHPWDDPPPEQVGAYQWAPNRIAIQRGDYWGRFRVAPPLGVRATPPKTGSCPTAPKTPPPPQVGPRDHESGLGFGLRPPEVVASS